MKKKIVLRVIVGVIGVVLLGVGVSYWWILGQYNATMYSKANDWIKEEFIYNNAVCDVTYINKDYNPDVDEWTEKYYSVEDAPKIITYIIKDEKAFNEIFIENSIDVNFEKEMVILFMKRDVCPRDCYLVSISNDYNGKLTFKYVHEFYIGGGDTVMPYPRCIVVKMKKLDITCVEFIDVY